MKKIFLLVALFTLSLFLLGCAGAPAKIAENGDTVSVWYTGKLESGEVFDTNVEHIGLENGFDKPSYEPLTIVLGDGGVVLGFNNAILGMKEGEKKEASIPPALGYGEIDESRITVYTQEEFKQRFEDMEQIEGKRFMFQKNDGRFSLVTMRNITEESITLDGNSALAGKTMVFDIEVISITKPGEQA